MRCRLRYSIEFNTFFFVSLYRNGEENYDIYFFSEIYTLYNFIFIYSILSKFFQKVFLALRIATIIDIFRNTNDSLHAQSDLDVTPVILTDPRGFSLLPSPYINLSRTKSQSHESRIKVNRPDT